MYAVIKTGGKQYRVSPGDKLKIETIDAEVGASYDFDTVLMISDGDKLTVGTPTIASAKVTAEVIAHGRAKKVEIIKFRRRKHHQKRTGHRQNFTQVEIQSINGKGAVAKKKAAPAKKVKAADSDADAKTAKKAAAPKKTAEKKPAAKKAAPKKAAPVKKSAKKSADDLTKIEGIGPKASEALVAAGLATFADLSKAKVPAIQKILDESDGKFGMMKPATWPKQAKMAADGKWDELKKWQDEMDGGVE
ncbi:MAG TPA: 50S ribosomal protein L21 [Leucothrix sp.]|nr:50S ribosomal protein L21 [Leucothrix sp.]